MPQPPPVVYVTGDLPRLPSVALVGTRKPTEAGETFASKLAYELVREGVAVLSGGADGIDTAAHRGALEGGGPTVVVAPSSFDRPYPDTNEGLFSEIVQRGGAHIATYPRGTPALRHQFFERNRVLAALAHALVVVESRFRGGARNAANAARQLGRPVLAVPGAPWIPTAAGCILELKAGAGIAASVRDVLAAIALAPLPETIAGTRNVEAGHSATPMQGELAWLLEEDTNERGPPARSVSGPPDADRDAVLRLLKSGPRWPHEIMEILSLPVPRLSALLLTLTLESVVVSEPSGRVSLANVGNGLCL